MKRLTLKNALEMNITELAFNQVFVQDSQAWYLKEPEAECSVCNLIRDTAKTLDITLEPGLTDMEIGDIMLDWLQFGETEPEGVLAILYRALWAMAEVRERLKLYEDMLFSADGTELITLDTLREHRTGMKNDPLTLEELREMDGEPVWVVSTGVHFEPSWNIISAEEEICVDRYGDSVDFEKYGEWWLAYRRKPEGRIADET